MILRALIFDVDGTLAETEEVHRRAFNETFAEADLPWTWSRADYYSVLRVSGGQEQMRAYCDDNGIKASAQMLADLHQVKTARYGDLLAAGALALRPGVMALWQAARAAGLKIGVCTATRRPNVDAICAACWGQPATEVFDSISSGDRVSQKKPAPDAYLLALEELNVAPEQALAIEDARNGLLAAKAAGMPVLITPSDYTAREDFSEADWVVPSLEARHLPKEVQRHL